MMTLSLLLTSLLACDVVTGPGYVDDFTDAFCSYQTLCGDPIALDQCGAPKKLTFDECAGFVARNHEALDDCEWNAEHAKACIEAYEALQTCPADGAPQPAICGEVYSGEAEACVVFPYPACADTSAPEDTAPPADTGGDTEAG